MMVCALIPMALAPTAKVGLETKALRGAAIAAASDASVQCGHVFDCACLLRVYARAPDTHAPCPSCRAPFTLDHAARWADMALQRMPPLSDERKREMQLALRELEEKQRTRLSAPPPPLRRRALDHLTSSPSCRRSWLSFCIGLACMLGCRIQVSTQL